MDWQIVWTEPALEAFAEAIRYLAERNSDSAEKLRHSIVEHVDSLARFPYIGPIYEHDSSRRTREIICRPYRIFYRLNETTKQIEILTVWHSSRFEPDLPEA